jgi:hypothetical protein
MSVVADMCEIVRKHAGDGRRYFVRADPETGEREVLHLRADLEWTERRRKEIDGELQEVVARESYEYLMNAENVNQIVTVADTKVLFTGFVEDELVIAAFDRGVLAYLPTVVAEFREYIHEHDVEFISLEEPSE